jgi:hypothetical protein
MSGLKTDGQRASTGSAREPMTQAQYSNHVRQRPLPVASQHDRQHTELAGTMAKRPAAPQVRDDEATYHC